MIYIFSSIPTHIEYTHQVLGPDLLLMRYRNVLIIHAYMRYLHLVLNRPGHFKSYLNRLNKAVFFGVSFCPLILIISSLDLRLSIGFMPIVST